MRVSYVQQCNTVQEGNHDKADVHLRILMGKLRPKSKFHYSPFQNYRRVNSYVRAVRTVARDSREFCMSVFWFSDVFFRFFFVAAGNTKDAKHAKSQMKRCEESLKRNESLK